MVKRKTTKKRPATQAAVRDGDVLISADEAGKMLGGASKKKLRRLIKSGEFNTYAFGGVTRYSRNEVQGYIARIKARGPSRAPWRGDASPAGR